MPKRRLRIIPYRGAKNYSFYLDGLKVNGKRKRLFFHTEKEALAELKRLEKQLRIEGEQGASISADLRIEAAQANARLAPFGKSIRDAADFYVKHLERISTSALLAPTADGYYQAKEREGLSKKHLGDTRRRLGRFVADFENRKIKTLTVAEIEDWLARLGALAPKTVNNHRAAICAFFSYALKRDLVDKNPVAAISKIKLVDKAPGIFTPGALAKLLAAAPPDLLPALVIQAFAGLRTAEVLRLDWREVTQAGYIEVTAAKAKTAKRRLVPIAPNLADWLRPYADRSGPVWTKTECDYHGAIRRSAVSLHKWPQNGLRHSFASYHLAEHQDAARLALALGHSTTALIFSNYRELVTPEAAHAYWAISPARPQNVVPMAKATV